MRITGGVFKGRRLFSPKGMKVRPTSDMVRQALFNILGHNYIQDWHSVKVLDLFAGTGALGLEALSRGASSVLFVESSPASIAALKRNVQSLGVSGRAEILKAGIDYPSNRLLKALETRAFDLIFSDPPYSTGLSIKSLALVAETGCLEEKGVVVIEERKGVELPREAEGKSSFLRLADHRVYGQTELWFYVGLEH